MTNLQNLITKLDNEQVGRIIMRELDIHDCEKCPLNNTKDCSTYHPHGCEYALIKWAVSEVLCEE